MNWFARKNKRKRGGGFTLIELLVVISIISLLSSIVLASLNSARDKAKDSATLQNIKQLQLALELYKSDNGFYPGQDGGLSGCDPGTCYGSFNSFSDLENLLSPYLPNIKFIESSFDTINYNIHYVFNFQDAFGSPYSCDNLEYYKDYLFIFPIYDNFGREINLPFTRDLSESLFSLEDYCIGK